MDTGSLIHAKRKQYKMTLEELADKMGVTKATVSKWENGYYDELKLSRIKQLSKILNISPIELCCFDEDNTQKQIPILGKVVAGYPLQAVENIIGYTDAPKNHPQGDYFALKVNGDSMQPRIQDGDILIVKRQNTAENGDIVIALVDNEDATCKKLIVHENGITLQPLNPNYVPLFFTNDEVINRPVSICGVVIENRQQFK